MAFLAVMASASPFFTTRTRTNAAANPVISTKVPICNFDLVKGEYICPPIKADSFKPTYIHEYTASKIDAVAAVTGCSRGITDPHEPMKVLYVIFVLGANAVWRTR